MEQRDAYRIHVIHNIGMAKLRMLANQIQSQQSAKYAAIEDHAAKITAEQDLNKFNKRIIPGILKQRDDLSGISYRKDNMASKNHPDNNKNSGNYEVIDTDPFFFPDQQIADYRTKKDSHCGTDRICAYRMSENFNYWIHKQKQSSCFITKQLLKKS